MARGYIMEEALGLCTEYMQNCTVTSCRVWDNKDEPSTNDELLQGKGRRRVLSPQLQQWIHEFVLNNAKILEDYRKYAPKQYDC
jgi:hypothetical protein